jgi:hypothetical protein
MVSTKDNWAGLMDHKASRNSVMGAVLLRKHANLFLKDFKRFLN